MEETDNINSVLPTENNVYVDNEVVILDSKIPVIMNNDEAEDREYEKVEKDDKGGL